jgi:uncharacterized protein (DUF302 family)
MPYYFNKTVSGSFDDVVEKVVSALKSEGFGVLTEIDVQSTLKQKIGVDFRAYRILGACNPPLAHKALAAEDKIGTMLPCNVIVQDLENGRIEIAAINPLVAMEKVGNPVLASIAAEVAGKLQSAVARCE